MSDLYDAVTEGHYNDVQTLLQGGADANEIVENESLLSLAVELQYFEIAKLLLKFGADMNLGIVPPLLHAMFAQDFGFVKLLLDNGANPNVTFSNKLTRPVHMAAFYANLPLAELLVAAKADLNVQDSEGNTPLIAAVYKNNYDIVKLYRGAGADPLIKSFLGKNALEYSIFYGNSDITNLLV